jgi:hypothetical protein
MEMEIEDNVLSKSVKKICYDTNTNINMDTIKLEVKENFKISKSKDAEAPTSPPMKKNTIFLLIIKSL